MSFSYIDQSIMCTATKIVSKYIWSPTINYLKKFYSTLFQIKVPSSTHQGTVNFRDTLLNRCQVEFEKHSSEEADLIKKQKEIESADSVSKMQEILCWNLFLVG